MTRNIIIITLFITVELFTYRHRLLRVWSVQNITMENNNKNNFGAIYYYEYNIRLKSYPCSTIKYAY